MKRGREDGASSVGGSKRVLSAKVPSGPQPKLTTNDALSYLREVKNRFADDKSVYDTFLEIMKEFKAQRIDTAGVIRKVKKLFKGHRSLVLGFNTFLPEGYEIELAAAGSDDEDDEVLERQPVEFDQAISYVNKIKVRFSSDERVYKAFLEILNMYRKSQKTISNVYEEVAILFQHHQDLLDEFIYFLPDSSQPAPASKGRQGGFGRGSAGARGGYASQQADHRSANKRTAAKRAEEGFKAGYGTDSYDKDAGQPALGKELQLFERIKQRLRSNDAYSDLLKCLNLYSQDIVPRHELMYLVGDILGKHPDLLSAFQEFLGKVEVMDMDFSSGGKTVAQLNAQRDLIRRKQLQKDKYLTKPLSEIVGNETERVTPSYVLIPSAYPKLACTGRTELGNSVLNETFANVISGSEDYSFKLMRKNQYEEALFRCEDDRYEFEMCIETNAAALKLLRPLVDVANKLSQEERMSYQLEADHPLLGPVPTNAIERLYTDSGAMIVDYLRKYPALAAPVVAARLEQKDAEWRKVRVEMTQIWKKIYEINYHKSLDHRSFYFKQAEKKGLLPKTMVAEIREAAEERKASNPGSSYRAMLCQLRRNSSPFISSPDLTYEYGDRLVFEDCWSVLRTSILESSGSGPKEQVVNFYLEALEPFLGMDLRKEDQEKLKAELKERRGGEQGEDAVDSSDQDEGTGKESTPEAGTTEMDQDSKAKSEDSSKEEDSDEEDEKDLSGSRPLNSLFDATRSTSCCRPPSELLLGNELMYIFFRYHRHLYERLRTARRCALQQAQQQCSGGSMKQSLAPSPLPDSSAAADENPAVKGPVQVEADKMHKSFMDMTLRVFTGDMEVPVYEDQVRALLGSSSYELFTIDKLVHKLITHMKVMVQDEQTKKLLELHHYEMQREPGSTSTMYLVNAGSMMDDTMYCIEYRNKGSELTIQLMDYEKTDMGPASLPAEGPVTESVAVYMEVDGDPLSASKVYLTRNVPVKGQDDEAIAQALPPVVVQNGLEYRVDCSNSKVSYQSSTEDVLLNPGRPRSGFSEATRHGRSVKLKEWLNSSAGKNTAEGGAAEAAAEPAAPPEPADMSS